MNSNIQTTIAPKKPPPVEQQQQPSPSAKGSVIFSFGSAAGAAKASTTGKDFFKSPITTTNTTTTSQPLISSLHHRAKSDSPESPLEKMSRSLVDPREAKKTRKVRTTWSAAVSFTTVVLSYLYTVCQFLTVLLSSSILPSISTGRRNAKEERCRTAGLGKY